MTMNLINRTILIEHTRAPLARALAAGLSAGGVGMFETPVYNQSQAITYYVSSGWIGAEWDMALKDANVLFEVCKGTATLSQCQDLINTSIVVDCNLEDAYSTYARLGLTI